LPRLLGGALCLDFVNTVEVRLSPQPVDFLAEPADLVRWGVHTAAIDGATAARVSRLMSSDAAAARTELARAVRLRESAYALLCDVCAGAAPRVSATATVGRELSRALGRAHLRPAGSGFAWEPGDGIHAVTDLVALDLNVVLTSSILSRVKRCPGCDDCGWLFLDTSRNGSRQWCSMEGCGSRAKMRRYHQRHHRR